MLFRAWLEHPRGGVDQRAQGPEDAVSVYASKSGKCCVENGVYRGRGASEMRRILLLMIILATGLYPQPSAARPVVNTASDAIRVAYSYWRATAPDSAPIAEEKWDKEFEAVLQGGVWCVDAKHAAGEPSSFGMYVGQEDGRYLGAFDLGTPQILPCGTQHGPRPSN